MLGEMLAAGLNANLGGREHMPIEVERQILRWLGPVFGMPEGAGGLFVTGSSMANFMAILVARSAALGPEVRRRGLEPGARLVAYASSAVHGCVRRGMEMSGLGSDALRMVPLDRAGRMDPDALVAAIGADRAAGLRPFLVVGTAGTVDTGAIDPLDRIAAVAEAEGLWFHVDGAYGALAMFAPSLAPRLAGIRRADSLALDFHKWGQVPYDAGYLMVRDGALQQRTFAAPAVYLGRDARGLAAGSPWLPGPEGLVHPEGLWHRPPGRGDRAHLRPGPVPEGPDRGQPGTGTDGSGQPQHRLLPHPRRPRRCAEPAGGGGAAGVGAGGAVQHHPGRPAGDPGRHRQPPHPGPGHRHPGGGGPGPAA